MTLIFEIEQHGRLWLGGEKAAHNSKLLADNDVYAVWPAYKGARPESPSVFGTLLMGLEHAMATSP